MTKYSLEALSDAMRFELAPFGIRVVLFELGSVRTDLMTTGMKTLPDGPGPYEQFKESFAAMVARAHRPGAAGILTPEAVAKTLVKVVRDRNPRPRYRIGLQAQLAPIIRRWVGDRRWDRMMARQVPVD